MYWVSGRLNTVSTLRPKNDLPNLFIGPKGVSTFTLLRLGLLWGKGGRAFQSGKYNQDWGLLNTTDIISLHSYIVSKLKIPGPFNVYDVLARLLGEVKAKEVAIAEGIPVRSSTTSVPIPVARSLSGPTKRKGLEDDDNEGGGEGPRGQRRRGA